jgi:hypothetical protein
MLAENDPIAGPRQRGGHNNKINNQRTPTKARRSCSREAVASQAHGQDSQAAAHPATAEPQPGPRNGSNNLLARMKAKQAEARVVTPAKDVFFCSPRYLVPDDRGVWIEQNRDDAAHYLIEVHRHSRKTPEDGLSSVDAELLRIRREQNVDYADSLAGYDKGYHTDLNGKRVLVTIGPKIIQPGPGDWSVVNEVISGLLADPAHDQAVYYHAWMRDTYNCLVSKKWRPAQILGLVGPANIGKSLLQSIITEITGGRDTSPYLHFSGRTDFNGELFMAEHLKIEDEAASTDIRARRQLGNHLKQVAANRRHKLHDKHNRGVDLPVFWRCTLSMNDEAENVLILPPMDDSLTDKFILLKCRAFRLPMPTDSPEQEEEFWKAVQEQLPHYVHWLTTEFVVPENLKSNRFGVRHFHHPDIIKALNELSPEEKLLQLIDTTQMSIFGADLNPWEGRAAELESKLTANDSGVQFEARRLFFTQASCGQYLARLNKRYPDRVQQAGSVHNTVIWKISPEPQPTSAETQPATSRVGRRTGYQAPEV